LGVRRQHTGRNHGASRGIGAKGPFIAPILEFLNVVRGGAAFGAGHRAAHREVRSTVRQDGQP
jgi:hypothetical protein